MQTNLFEETKFIAKDKKSKGKYKIKNRNWKYDALNPLDVLSLGFGTQSTALAFMAGFDMIPRPHYVIFADTGAEPSHVYDYASKATELLKQLGVNVITCQKSDLYKDVLRQIKESDFIALPLYFLDSRGKRKVLNRRCTVEYKIEAIAQEVRRITNRQRLPTHSIRMWLGITREEMKRVKPVMGTGRYKFRQTLYPFLPHIANITYSDFDWSTVFSRNGFSKADCIKFFKANSLPVPPKSSCKFCPFHGNEEWRVLREQSESEFIECIEIDTQIRNLKIQGFEGKQFYLHPSCSPLDSIDFTEKREVVKLIDTCNSGYCFI